MNFTSGIFSSKTLVYIINGIILHDQTSQEPRKLKGKKEKKNIKYMYTK